jgi:large-conductance mechanosensitive channel
MSFSEFIYDQGIVGITIGTITGFAISNLMKDINREVIIKILTHFKVSNAGLLSSLLEFSALLFIVYLLYHFVLYPLFQKNMKLEKDTKQQNLKWKKNLLSEVKNIDMGTVYMN